MNIIKARAILDTMIENWEEEISKHGKVADGEAVKAYALMILARCKLGE